MRRTLVMITVGAGLMASSLGAAIAWDQATPVTVDLSSYRFAPSTLRLNHGQTYVLRFRNTAGKKHNFVAKDFFASSSIAPGDAGKVSDGGVDLRGGETADVRLVPGRRGTFQVHCSHFMHGALGMKGAIIVQ